MNTKPRSSKGKTVKMKSNELVSVLSPFKKVITSKKTISPLYSSIQLSKNKVAACSHFAILEAKTNLGIEETVYVDSLPFLAVIDSLPKDQEVVIKVKDKVLHWSCGSATGKLGTVDISEMPQIPNKLSRQAWTPTTDFAEAIKLGALSCEDADLQSVGLFGVAVDLRDDNIQVLSSDDVSLSVCETKTGKPENASEVLTFSPISLNLLSSVMCCVGSSMELGQTLFYVDNVYRLLINQIPPLSRDYRAIYQNFKDGEVIADVPRDRVKAFIKRSMALAENSRGLHVILRVEKGKLSYLFDEGPQATASSEEYYLVEGLDIPDLVEINLDASRVSRALQHVDRVVLDYIQDNVIVFRGADPEFYYIVSGKKG